MTLLKERRKHRGKKHRESNELFDGLISFKMNSKVDDESGRDAGSMQDWEYQVMESDLGWVIREGLPGEATYLSRDRK